MARTFQMNRFYPAPGASSKADGFSIDISGDAAFQAMLVKIGPLVKARALNIVKVLALQLAVEANAAAPRGPKGSGRSGGRLAQSFRFYDRPQWEQLGKVGVAVRSSTKYHYFQEFGVNRSNVQVVLHQDAWGKKVRRGQGIDRHHGRYAIGTNRLNPGVFVKTYRRDIRITGRPFFGEIVRRTKGTFEQQARNAIQTYIARVSAEAT